MERFGLSTQLGEIDMKNKRHFIKQQRTFIKKGKKLSEYTSQSPYWDWNSGRVGTEGGIDDENQQANPDFLSSSLYNECRNPEDLLQTVESLTIIRQGYSHLTNQERRVFILIGEEQKTQQEVSDILRISRGSVMTYLNRARTKLIKHVNKKLH